MTETLIRVCQEVGRKVPLWTQGPGSNLSVKTGEDLWIKGSGKRLDAIRSCHDLARVGIRNTLEGLKTLVRSEEAYSDLLRRETDPAYARASMETGFHVLLPSTWVLHFHSLPAILLADDLSRNRLFWENWLAATTDLSFGVLEPVLPGWKLSQKIVKKFGRKAPELILLRSHGLVLHGEDPDVLLRSWELIESTYLKSCGIEGEFKAADLEICRWPGKSAFYFPDAAVFWDRTRQCLEPYSDGYRLNASVSTLNRDAVEIWIATQWLQRARVDLEPLDKEICALVSVLPTEIARRSINNL